MFGIKPDKEKNLKNLSEKDIQKQLYGDYLKAEDRVEVMDSSFIVREGKESPILEKVDQKARKEVGAELDSLKSEFKRLQGEVNRLKKEKESLDKPDIWFRPPLLKTRQLVIIGSIVVLLAFAGGIVYTAKFLVSKMGHSGGSKASIEKSVEPVKKEAAAKKIVPSKKPAKKTVRKKP
ncbi:MAG TPA: hypothetical protein PLV09_05365 [Candidatus Omnitrophota bacterium]|nr:hypothetical protein [Candidatus Omnitrophota bacterium]HOX09968.1 hypothetical protein [Candidatus Omnitrophota bacterium]HPN66830.1 hypothetical protein [Candidatus Omnitrophota bacterium]HRZ66653.1 hypothetical protein [Candidatus Omnitrophota bacterium]